MTLLPDDLVAAIKTERAKAWTKPFTVLTYTEAATSYYNSSVSSVSQVLSGDWAWRQQHVRRGSPGGAIDRADLVLCTDILHSGALMPAPGSNDRVRIQVDGILCSITEYAPFADFGEIVIAAARVV